MRARLVAAAIICLTAPLLAVPALAQCAPATGEKTRWGGNQRLTLTDKRANREIAGIVESFGVAPLAGVLVEVYDHPEAAPQGLPPPESKQTQIAACITGEDGRFSLAVPPGRYEVRFSKSSEWDVTSFVVTVRRSAHRSRKALVVLMKLGT